MATSSREQKVLRSLQLAANNISSAATQAVKDGTADQGLLELQTATVRYLSNRMSQAQEKFSGAEAEVGG